MHRDERSLNPALAVGGGGARALFVPAGKSSIASLSVPVDKGNAVLESFTRVLTMGAV